MEREKERNESQATDSKLGLDPCSGLGNRVYCQIGPPPRPRTHQKNFNFNFIPWGDEDEKVNAIPYLKTCLLMTIIK
jgi:hypothetical protein